MSLRITARDLLASKPQAHAPKRHYASFGVPDYSKLAPADPVTARFWSTYYASTEAAPRAAFSREAVRANIEKKLTQFKTRNPQLAAEADALAEWFDAQPDQIISGGLDKAFALLRSGASLDRLQAGLTQWVKDAGERARKGNPVRAPGTYEFYSSGGAPQDLNKINSLEELEAMLAEVAQKGPKRLQIPPEISENGRFTVDEISGSQRALCQSVLGDVTPYCVSWVGSSYFAGYSEGKNHVFRFVTDHSQPAGSQYSFYLFYYLNGRLTEWKDANNREFPSSNKPQPIKDVEAFMEKAGLMVGMAEASRLRQEWDTVIADVTASLQGAPVSKSGFLGVVINEPVGASLVFSGVTDFNELLGHVVDDLAAQGARPVRGDLIAQLIRYNGDGKSERPVTVKRIMDRAGGTIEMALATVICLRDLGAPDEAADGSNAISGRELAGVIKAGGDLMKTFKALESKGVQESPEKLAALPDVDGLYIEPTPVTQGLYEEIMGKNPVENAAWRDPQKPVVNVSWYDAVEFCNKRSARDGLDPCYTNDGDFIEGANGWRLLTSSEYEMAARGGRDENGEVRSKTYTYGPLDEIAVWNRPYEEGPSPVGSKKPNALGLYDMIGNVWSWTDPDRPKQKKASAAMNDAPATPAPRGYTRPTRAAEPQVRGRVRGADLLLKPARS